MTFSIAAVLLIKEVKEEKGRLSDSLITRLWICSYSTA